MMAPEEVVDAIIRQLTKEAGPAPFFFLEGMADDLFRPLARDIVASGARYLLVEKKSAILCLKCGMVSHNPNDVAQRYCGSCREFADTTPCA